MLKAMRSTGSRAEPKPQSSPTAKQALSSGTDTTCGPLPNRRSQQLNSQRWQPLVGNIVNIDMNRSVQALKHEIQTALCHQG